MSQRLLSRRIRSLARSMPALLALASAAGAQTEPPAAPSQWSAWLEAAKDLQQRASEAVDAAIDYAQPLPRRDGMAILSASPEGPTSTPLAEAGPLPQRLVVLIHGLDEPGSIWDDLTPTLVAQGEPPGAGFGTAVFTYPDDQPITDSSRLLLDELRTLDARGVERIDLVCHSMGGLVARDALTRAGAFGGDVRTPDGLPRVDRLVLVGTPLAGSPWARLRAVAELRQQIVGWASDKSLDPRKLLGFMNDGEGQAGSDLLPGSDFLNELNARPWPEGLAVTSIIGTVTPAEGPDLSWLRESRVLRDMMGDEQADRLAGSLDSLSRSLGDGVVSVESATPRGLPEPADIVRVEATHRGLLKGSALEQNARALAGRESQPTPPAIPVILDRLGVETADR
jgi:pimeloyl-ACP methyl ester carboxylesterase